VTGGRQEGRRPCAFLQIESVGVAGCAGEQNKDDVPGSSARRDTGARDCLSRSRRQQEVPAHCGCSMTEKHPPAQLRLFPEKGSRDSGPVFSKWVFHWLVLNS